MKGKIALLASSVAIAGLLSIGIAATAFAADPAPTPGAWARGPMAGAVCGWGGGAGYGSVNQALEKLTGLTSDEIIALREGGKSAVQIAHEKGVSEDDLLNEILAARKAALDEAVKDGRITQERADYMLQNMTERVKEGITRTDIGPRGPRDRGLGPARGNQMACPYGVDGERPMRGGMGRWAKPVQ
ncbi:MAG: hypothetical protein ACOX87_14255 [Chloroflexota bacterium]|jgi:Spy/CpxP family protein refolding chaperone